MRCICAEPIRRLVTRAAGLPGWREAVLSRSGAGTVHEVPAPAKAGSPLGAPALSTGDAKQDGQHRRSSAELGNRQTPQAGPFQAGSFSTSKGHSPYRIY